MSADWPKTDNHRLFMEEMENLLEKKGELTRKEISKTLAKKMDLTKDTMMMWLSKYRAEIESYGFITESRDDGSPGTPTVYWRLEE